ncbi:hypothetical protein FHS43_004932 [Streptosporangium becharense]|uniref:Uncharacterized protein n=1 Tax=Streptosporangium becharense TaxID=1816182 RepID=A0A7W9ICJ6_9ACTN|nr:hypothetical protein [Streptosporangium becharense]MBB2913623.1 hypothetical protein [Streptosporangium becharense]MBB5817704.1 hypothetical protein [Streptosporangium becharense]
MRVELSGEVLSTDALAADVLEFMRLFTRGVHNWVLDPEDIEEVSTYLHRHAPMLAHAYTEFAIKTSVVSQAWSVTDQPTLFVSRVTIEDDLHDLRQPAVLIVEDAVSDRCFLQGIAHVFDGDDVMDAIVERRLELLHGGGKDRACAQAPSARERFRRTSRVALFLDSDRLTPGETTKCHRLAERLEPLGIAVHILNLREAENYIPSEVLRGALRPREASRLLDQLTQLTPEQRGHFDMKHGFPKAREDGLRVPPGHQNLYDGVPDRVIDKLRTGFGTKLTELLEREAASGKLTAEHFEDLGKGVVEELHAILTMLRKII